MGERSCGCEQDLRGGPHRSTRPVSKQSQKLLPADGCLVQDGLRRSNRYVFPPRDNNQTSSTGWVSANQRDVASLPTFRCVAEALLAQSPDRLFPLENGELRHRRQRSATSNCVVNFAALANEGLCSRRPSSLALSRKSSTAWRRFAIASSMLSPQDATPSSGHLETTAAPSCQQIPVSRNRVIYRAYWLEASQATQFSRDGSGRTGGRENSTKSGHWLGGNSTSGRYSGLMEGK